MEHIKELNNEIPENMVVFLKTNSSITNTLVSEHNGEALHYEGEISFLYKNGKFSAVAFGLDLTKRGLQSRLKEKGLPWERAKTFNGASLFSEFVDFDCDFSALSLNLAINGKMAQSAGIGLMMYKPDEILNEILQFISLNDGDIVMTGTPKGVGLINKGDIFTGEIMDGNKLLVRESWKAN